MKKSETTEKDKGYIFLSWLGGWQRLIVQPGSTAFHRFGKESDRAYRYDAGKILPRRKYQRKRLVETIRFRFWTGG